MTSAHARQRGLELLERGAQGDAAATSQLITAVESRSETGRAVLDEIYARGGRAHIVGITGAPGSGKSTLVGALAGELRRQGLRAAIVAVDPSSSITGGAILGDRIRMTEHTLDPGVYVRSMSSRGMLGGLARATFDVVTVLDAAGWDVVLVETVGVGQAEVEIAQLAHTTVVVSVPGLGDDIQAIKAGLLEVADLHVVNKIDRPDSNKTIAELKTMLRLAPQKSPDAWHIPVLGTSAHTGEGVAELVTTLAAHRAWLDESAHRVEREWDNAAARVRAVVKEIVAERMQDPALADEFEATVDAVVARKLHLYAAAERLVDSLNDDRQAKDRTDD